MSIRHKHHIEEYLHDWNVKTNTGKLYYEHYLEQKDIRIQL